MALFELGPDDRRVGDRAPGVTDTVVGTFE